MNSTDDAYYPVPITVATRFGHAYVEQLARDTSTRLLHLKGPAADPTLRDPHRPPSTDVDVLVDPRRTRAMLRELRAEGWSLETGFESGSPFAHAATLRHPTWGYLDLHRQWPGFEIDRESAFDLLWADRTSTTIAGFDCPVPSTVDQRILLCLNAIRSQLLLESPDVKLAWGGADESTRRETLQRVGALRADVAFSVVTGDLERHRGARSYRLWRETVEPTDRLSEWRARFEAARGTDRVRLVARAPWVNRAHLAAILGRQPSTAEVLAAQRDRWRAGWRELMRRAKDAAP